MNDFNPTQNPMRYSLCLVLSLIILSAVSSPLSSAEKLTLKKARITVTGHDVNRPRPYPGRGKFSWAGNVIRLANGNLMFVHTAGYYHVSFAEPRDIEPSLRKKWLAEGWPLDFKAPTGGRTMRVISPDNGRTWSQPKTIIDLPLDDGGYGLLRAKDETLLCFINIQASWYGYRKAPAKFRKDILGMNSHQCVIRSTDGGKTWSKPIYPDSPGDFYQRSHAQPIILPSGTILWVTYCIDSKWKGEFGVVHRSNDHGKTWRVRSTVKRKNIIVDEPAIAHIGEQELIMICRPDGGRFRSSDEGRTWVEEKAIGKVADRLKAPRLFVLKDRTVVCACTYRGRLQLLIGRRGGREWTKPIMVDPNCYGYPGGIMLEDGTLLVTYNSSGRAPNRVHAVRLKINDKRTGFDFLAIGK